jgi:hypothetical protein
MPSMNRFWAGILIGTLAAGCTGGDTATPAAMELADKVRDAGYCTKPVHPDLAPKNYASCGYASILSFVSAGARDRYIASFRATRVALFCSEGGPSYPGVSIAVGRYWFAADQRAREHADRDKADRLADALDGEARFLSCE